MKLLMSETQFDVSMIDLTMSFANRKIARQFFVEGLTPAELKMQGVSPSRLSKVTSRVLINFDKQSDKLGLISRHLLLDKKTASLVGALEEAKIAESLYKAQQKKRKLKAKKITPEAFSSAILELELN
ncbi:MAG: hypothetical protein CL692_07065 [Cellvibrionales bacterium]|nr:hypothetical protein [Cellvibrionales bacterium]